MSLRMSMSIKHPMEISQKRAPVRKPVQLGAWLIEMADW